MKSETTTTTNPTDRRHPGPYTDYPRDTPRNERLPIEFRDSEHTVETWAAYVAAPAVTKANAIRTAAAQLRQLAQEWLEEYGSINDPGAAAITLAGLPRPAPVHEYGTQMQHVRAEFAALAWAVGAVVSNLAELPDAADPQNDPANVRRLLGEAGQG